MTIGRHCPDQESRALCRSPLPARRVHSSSRTNTSCGISSTRRSSAQTAGLRSFNRIPTAGDGTPLIDGVRHAIPKWAWELRRHHLLVLNGELYWLQFVGGLLEEQPGQPERLVSE